MCGVFPHLRGVGHFSSYIRLFGLALAEERAGNVGLGVAVGDPISEAGENGLVISFGGLGLIEPLGLIGAFALDDNLLFFDRGFAFQSLGLRFGLHFRIPRRLAGDDLLGLGFPCICCGLSGGGDTDRLGFLFVVP